MTVDFSKLDLKDTLDLAIAVEEEAMERYVEFAEQLEAHHGEDVAAFFREMARVEEGHRDMLLARRRELFGDEPARVSAEMIFDVEALDYDQVRAFMSVRAAVEAALAGEKKAWSYYDSALKWVKDEEVSKLFRELRDVEQTHIDMVRAKLEQLGEGEEIGPDGYVDEPTAQ